MQTNSANPYPEAADIDRSSKSCIMQLQDSPELIVNSLDGVPIPITDACLDVRHIHSEVQFSSFDEATETN